MCRVCLYDWRRNFFTLNGRENACLCLCAGVVGAQSLGHKEVNPEKYTLCDLGLHAHKNQKGERGVEDFFSFSTFLRMRNPIYGTTMQYNTML